MKDDNLLQEISAEYTKPKRKRGVKKETKQQKNIREANKLIKYVLITISLAVALYSSVVFNKWSRNNWIVIQSPITLRTPMYIMHYEHSEDDKPVKPYRMESTTKEQIINEYEFKEYIAKVWMLESTQGKNDVGYHKSCEEKGLVNEFGYDVAHEVCFNSFRENVEAVNSFFKENLKIMERNEAICYYNTGYVIKSCAYLDNFMSL